MRSRSTVALAVLAVAGLLVPAGASPGAEEHLAVSGKRCGQVGFTPNTDDVAGAIRARDMSCRRARRLIRRFHARDIEPAGFSCRRREHYLVLNHTDYRCVAGERRMSWEKY